MQKYKQKGEKWMLVVDDNCERSFIFASIGRIPHRHVGFRAFALSIRDGSREELPRDTRACG
jgi:hypothetical protein